MNLWLIGLLAIVIIVFILVSIAEKRKKEERVVDSVVPDPFKREKKYDKMNPEVKIIQHDKPIKLDKEDLSSELGDFAEHLSLALVYFFKLFWRMLKFIFGVLREFWKWFRAKPKEVQSRRQSSSRRRG